MHDEDDVSEFDIELPVLPRIETGPPPECPFCGEPMTMIDGDWGCSDCNGELIGPETG
ncbi:MAG: hypothetical protein KC563_11165 [Nitrospira sp.]|nr:hypothetical protein [Nitrospira sp.]MCB9709571.1 hypothetical protein [Nitrospiraceae bacterium]MDR4487078.1 hypothetical protein [Nitrospirales bacterium]MCA9464736.1 hypothetical protein [Nitrospira sp.]MCA9476342.1 hypothetical protein [Nitrospira sp.]